IPRGKDSTPCEKNGEWREAGPARCSRSSSPKRLPPGTHVEPAGSWHAEASSSGRAAERASQARRPSHVGCRSRVPNPRGTADCCWSNLLVGQSTEPHQG